MVTILIIDVALVAWSLHLIQESIARREFSLLLAGTLVAMASIAMVIVYFMMGSCIGPLTEISNHSYLWN